MEEVIKVEDTTITVEVLLARELVHVVVGTVFVVAGSDSVWVASKVASEVSSDVASDVTSWVASEVKSDVVSIKVASVVVTLKSSVVTNEVSDPLASEAVVSIEVVGTAGDVVS
jgi:hypothetical protein